MPSASAFLRPPLLDSRGKAIDDLRFPFQSPFMVRILVSTRIPRHLPCCAVHVAFVSQLCSRFQVRQTKLRKRNLIAKNVPCELDPASTKLYLL
ncbi:hypothetical protein BP00DRAFT_199126 [Aspergillus indologenus CBS 114.80]|uniref:Uncharacterized protein n=1 Tax=Aspergillus indologenus CBS 114.80 TaxID=1450541 RepID=A0A2V5I672_9EURO|nr:hypothetical protein BP00DRAFT_199126 [Aspergillus indologenus CBS 114.80]